MKKNCIVAQSGGPTAAINASLAGIIQEITESGCFETIYGSIHGIQGVIREQFLDLTPSTPEFINRLKCTPATYLGSCRFKLPSMEVDTGSYEKIFGIFEKMNVDAFFYIGGNDSMDTVDKLSQYALSIDSDIKIAGIPKTIDNDLVHTDHTPGFGSAAKYIASSIREIAYDTYIYDVESVTIVEIMGRDAGWLTAASVLARDGKNAAPHLIYLPEVAFDEEAFLSDLKHLLHIHQNIIVAVSEGVHDANGVYLSATSAAADKFGHAQLSGAGKYLETLVKARLNIKVRSVEINVLQRCAGHMASKTDLDESFLLGRKAVTLVQDGKSGFMTTLTRTCNQPYSYELASVPVGEVANKAKAVPLNWITEEKNYVTEEMTSYLAPLILGEVPIEYEAGIPKYLDISHLL
ncbi:MAG: 6-phosphofructokinase [Clostridium sp.]|nr:6-phosphofructokinase [Clostridium sp.]MCM1398446.1 6-phosphofructokinase [Clostridium sp.]MCM1458889.1 6-phosphofructokinase [Bacteroides sp.]